MDEIYVEVLTIKQLKDERKLRLLSAVEDQIVGSPTTKFREFLDVLQNEPSLQHLATRLENTHSELEGVSQHMGLLGIDETNTQKITEVLIANTSTGDKCMTTPYF